MTEPAHSPRAEVTPPPARRPDASMTLLNEVMERPLDGGYAAAQAARQRGTAVPQTPARRIAAFAIALLLGFVAVWSARELRTPATVATGADVLIEQIQERSAIGEQLAAKNTDIRAELTKLQEQALGSEASVLLKESSRLGVWAGTIPVEGPGLVVTVKDSPQVADGGLDDAGRVRDSDLQLVVNDLWASGAEAIAINGHRLTGQTAIRIAGDAILVDLQPLMSPYTIHVIGDPSRMRTEFARTRAASVLNLLEAQYAIASSIETIDQLRLPGGTASASSVVMESS